MVRRLRVNEIESLLKKSFINSSCCFLTLIKKAKVQKLVSVSCFQSKLKVGEMGTLGISDEISSSRVGFPGQHVADSGCCFLDDKL